MRADELIGKAITKAADRAAKRAARSTVTTLPAEYVGRDGEGKAWVLMPGAESPTPVRRMAVEAAVGDTVSATVGNGRVTVDANISNPSAGVAGVQAVGSVAGDAKLTADAARKDAKDALRYSDAARGAARDAQASADSALEGAEVANANARAAVADAATANQAANAAVNDAARAREAADSAQESADSAMASARSAAASANDALVQLATVEDVVDTLGWIAEHGTYEPTEDEHVDPGKVYYTRTGSGTSEDPWVYTAVPEPTEAGLSGYFELSIDEAVSQYVASHLALTDAGLYVLKDDSGYKLLVSNEGMSVIDPLGHVVVSYGSSITASADRPFSIGNEDAYVLFTPATETEPAKVVIGGNVELGSGKTLSEWEADIGQAVSDSSAAVQAANDVPIVTLSSTNGTVFKRNLGVSTTIVATIFTPGGRIDNAAELHRRFGNGAYLEWGWRDVVTDAMHVIVSGDPRIGNNGFTLTVDPEDIDVQAVITCSLNY